MYSHATNPSGGGPSGEFKGKLPHPGALEKIFKYLFDSEYHKTANQRVGASPTELALAAIVEDNKRWEYNSRAYLSWPFSRH